MNIIRSWRRIGRLVNLMPDQAKRLGCRREDHDLREAVEDVTPLEGEDITGVLERRRAMVRTTVQVGSRVRMTCESAQGLEGVITGTRPVSRGSYIWEVQLDAYDGGIITCKTEDFEVIG